MRKPVLNTNLLVQHGLPIDLLNATALTSVVRDFMDKIIIRPSACTAVHVNLLHEPVLAYHPDGKRVATSSRICWAPWEGPGGSDMPSLFSHTCLKIP